MTCLIRACFPRLRLLKGKKNPHQNPCFSNSRKDRICTERDSSATAGAWRMSHTYVLSDPCVCHLFTKQPRKGAITSARLPHSTSHVARLRERSVQSTSYVPNSLDGSWMMSAAPPSRDSFLAPGLFPSYNRRLAAILRAEELKLAGGGEIQCRQMKALLTLFESNFYCV